MDWKNRVWITSCLKIGTFLKNKNVFVVGFTVIFEKFFGFSVLTFKRKQVFFIWFISVGLYIRVSKG